MSIERARHFRKRMPPAEARVWNLLRAEPFKQYHFRRQVPLGRYFTDFASHAAKLVLEVDGDTHGSGQAVRHDRQRDAFIQSQGFQVLRLTNHDVMNNLEGVAASILTAIEITPNPSPQGRGERKALPGGDV